MKVFGDDGTCAFRTIEQALQWVARYADALNIVSVNMSLGDAVNYTEETSLYGLRDELAVLAARNVIVCSAAGNDFYSYGGEQGVSYPAADPNSLAVGAVYDAYEGGFTYSDGAKVYSTEADRICPFSQRRSTLTTILAPGAVITGADSDGGTVDMHGTSQASPHIAGIAVLAQQLAETALGRRLTIDEFAKLMRVSADWINDGDDENDNADHTGLDFPRVNMLALAEAILSLGGEDTHTVLLEPGEIVRDIDFGNAYSPPDRTLTISSTAGGSVATPGEGDFVFAHGATVAVSASAENLYHFLNWSGTAVDAGKIEDETSESTTVTVDADYTLVANFAEDEPVISISPESLAFDSVEVGETKDLSFTVENTGGGTLTGTASSAEPFTIESGESYSLLHGETHSVTVRFAPPSAADYSAAIACSGGDGAAVKATGTGVISPSSEYYVAPSPSGDDGNTGKSMDRPFATIQKAIDTAESNGIQPVAIHVTAGTWTENVVVPPSVEIVFDCGCDVSDGLTAIKTDDKTSPTLTLSGKVTVRNLALE